MSDARLRKIAEQAMRERGFEPEPPPDAEAEAAAAAARAQHDHDHDHGHDHGPDGVRDLTALPWTSIDNPESRDLDQIEALEPAADGATRLYVGIADVARYAAAGGAIDRHARTNTATVYTGIRTFAMLPERLSFDVTSLLDGQRRDAVVLETVVQRDGTLAGAARAYPARVLNRAKLDYPSVSAWLDGHAPPPAPLAADAALRAQVEAQDALARALGDARRRAGALDVDTAELRATLDADGRVTGLAPKQQDRAGRIVEELMVASNRAVAMALDAAGFASLRRVVRRPARWPRIVEYARGRGHELPAEPDSPSLGRFVAAMRAERPGEFAEISLAIVKLLGRGEYVAHTPGDVELGHFGLATAEYAHATAPNRRYPDLITQRLLLALRGGHAAPYARAELDAIAARATEMEAAAQKVERRVQKSLAAALLAPRVGHVFDAIVTGAKHDATFVRVLEPTAEGKLVRGARGREVGDKLRVRLVDVSVDKGFIDFESV
jgi:exoribonuclease II